MERPDPLLDVTGLTCPLPVLKARPFLRRLAPGTRAFVRADDPMARVDLPHMCEREGHRLLGEHVEGSVLTFEVVTGARAPAPSTQD